MKELNKNNVNAMNEMEKKQELFSIPNEVSCSPEFSEGCILSE